MVACLTDIEYGIEIGCLSRRRQHGAYASFQFGYLGCYGIVCGVLQSGIEISRVFQVEQTSHLFAVIVFKSSTLINR